MVDPDVRGGRHVHREEIGRGVAGSRIERLDEGLGGRQAGQVAALAVEGEHPGVADVTGGDRLLVEDVRFDEIAAGVSGVLVIAEHGQLLRALFQAALAGVDGAEGRARVGGRIDAVTVDVDPERREDVAVDDPTVGGQGGEAGLDQAFEVLAVGGQRQAGCRQQTDQRDGRDDFGGWMTHGGDLISRSGSFRATRTDPASGGQRALDRTAEIIHYVRRPNKGYF